MTTPVVIETGNPTLALQSAPYRTRIAELMVKPRSAHNHISLGGRVTS